MPDVIASYGTKIKSNSKLLHIHQTFADCLFNQYTHFDILIYQMVLQVTEGSLVQLGSRKFQCLIRCSSSSFHKFCGKFMKIIPTYNPATCSCMF